MDITAPGKRDLRGINGGEVSFALVHKRSWKSFDRFVLSFTSSSGVLQKSMYQTYTIGDYTVKCIGLRELAMGNDILQHTRKYEFQPDNLILAGH